jgi:hypothetical protein
MSTYHYALLSSASDTNADMETTNAGCGYTYNGVANVCYYASGLVPSNVVMFRMAEHGPTGLAVQASPSGTPTGTWSFDGDVEVTVSTATGTVTFAPWDGAAALTDEQRAKVIRARKPQRQGAAPAPQHA